MMITFIIGFAVGALAVAAVLGGLLYLYGLGLGVDTD